MTWILLLALVPSVLGHGRLTTPRTRDQVAASPEYVQNAPVARDSSSFVCRDFPAGTPAVTLTAGGTLDMQWDFTAAHVGDCFVYITYDTDLPDTQQQYYKIHEVFKCKDHMGSPFPIPIPSYLAACDHCVLRWEWYALHVRPGSIEYYSQCVDVSVVSEVATLDPTLAPKVLIGPHLPADPLEYRDAFTPSSPQYLTGPLVASIGGTSPSSSTTGGTSTSATTTGGTSTSATTTGGTSTSATTTGGTSTGVTTTGTGTTSGGGMASRCGTDYSSSACGQACPGGSNGECPSGQACYGSAPACGNKRCGTDAADAGARCGVACPDGTNGPCPVGQACFSEPGTSTWISCATSSTTADPTAAPTSGASRLVCCLALLVCAAVVLLS